MDRSCTGDIQCTLILLLWRYWPLLFFIFHYLLHYRSVPHITKECWMQQSYACSKAMFKIALIIHLLKVYDSEHFLTNIELWWVILTIITFLSFSALSILQHGKLPRILSADLIEEVFNSDSPRQFVKDLRSGLDSLGLFQVRPNLITYMFATAYPGL